MRLFKGLVGATVALGMVGLPGVAMAADPAGDDIVTLNLYNLTDVHGHIEKVEKKGKVKESGLAAVGCYLNKAKENKENFAFTLLGDNIGASPFTSGSLYDNPTIAALNELHPVASTIGNHELDLGQDVFRARIKGTEATIHGEKVKMTKVGFPYMAANVSGSLDDVLGKYKIEDIAGVKVAYISGIAEDMPYKLAPNTTAGMKFADPIKTINKLAEELKTKGDDKGVKADVVIAMLDDDVKKNINSFNDYVDGLMGGDTHVPYYFSRGTEVPGVGKAKITGTASGSYTDNLSNLQVKYDKTNHKILETKAIQIPAAEVAKCGQDPAIAKIVSQAVASSKKAGEKVVATGFTKPFYRAVYQEEKGKKIAPGSNRGSESTLGDLIADSIKATTMTQGKDPKPVDIGIINAGGIREDLIPKDGKLTYADTYAVMPFSNEMGYITLTGAEFKQTLEEQWKVGLSTQNSRPMLKLGVSSNVHYTYDWTKPLGHRITSLTVDGKSIDMKKKYTVGSVTFLLAGGDSFDTIGKVNKEKGRAYVNTGNLDRDEFNKYLAKFDGKGINPETAKRSVGISYNSSTKQIELRGLSFTEAGNFADATPFAKEVTVKIGSLPLTGKVDNNLYDPNGSWSNNADPSKAFVTTDGAGTAKVTVPVDSLCWGQSAGEHRLPLTVTTNPGAEVVKAEQGLTFDFSCVKDSVAGKPEIKINKGAKVEKGQLVVFPGSEVTLEADGFIPGLPVEFRIESKPVILGSVKADSNGKAILKTVLPKDLALGKHTVFAKQIGPNGTIEKSLSVYVKANPAPTKSSLAKTGSNTIDLSLYALTALMFGGCLILVYRTRKVK